MAYANYNYSKLMSIDPPCLNDPELPLYIMSKLRQNGWVLLRGYQHSMTMFSDLLKDICSNLSFDPAREFTNKNVQKVDAGTEAIGLHIENGNTPLVPDIVAFYSEKSAKQGSQTTFCDGVKLLQALPDPLLSLFDQPYTMRRNLSKATWQQYIYHEFLKNSIDDCHPLDKKLLNSFLNSVPGQSGTLDDLGNLAYQLEISAIITSKISQQPAFANALMGPSFNYQVPTLHLHSGQPITAPMLEQLSAIAEQHTQAVQWQDGDVLILDNRRVMHGRREIIGDPDNRKLAIGMGNI